MSFQDVGNVGPARRPANLNTMEPIRESATTGTSIGGLGVGESSIISNGASTGGSSGFGQVSDGILQYQRNVGILEKITRNVGTSSDGPILETQFRVQVDVVRQLGDKIDKQLQMQERGIDSMSRPEAARSRATLVKLTRDFRRVENTFRHLQQEFRRKKSLADTRRRDQEEEDRNKSNETNPEEMRLQLQMQEDKMNEEVMHEREEEIRNINKGMRTVNEIYKDLAHIVGGQQSQIDEVETSMENANDSAQAGLVQIEKANTKASQASLCTIS